MGAPRSLCSSWQLRCSSAQQEPGVACEAAMDDAHLRLHHAGHATPVLVLYLLVTADELMTAQSSLAVGDMKERGF